MSIRASVRALGMNRSSIRFDLDQLDQQIGQWPGPCLLTGFFFPDSSLALTHVIVLPFLVPNSFYSALSPSPSPLPAHSSPPCRLSVLTFADRTAGSSLCFARAVQSFTACFLPALLDCPHGLTWSLLSPSLTGKKLPASDGPSASQ